MAAQASSRPRVRVAALVLLEGKVVLVRHAARSSRYHLLPGGGVEFGETLEEALVREVLEETGLAVAVGDPVLLSDTIDPSGRRHVVNITFSCSVIGGALGKPQDPRIEAVDLITPDGLAALDLRPPMAREIKDVLEQPGGPARYLGSLFTPER